jgi:formate hydrogenlyase subunit 3/multisubunit Na+/H+ antiporter MnhD subunit
MNSHVTVLPVILPLIAAIILFIRRGPGGGKTLLATWAGVGWAIVELLREIMTHGPRRYQIGGWGVPLGIDYYLDGTGIIMLAMTAGLLSTIAWYSIAYFRNSPAGVRDHYWPLLLLVWASLNNLFLTGDIFNMYVTLELLGLLSVGLIALAGTPDAYAAALRYLLAALAGSMFYLLGVAMVYSSSGSLDWVSLRVTLVGGPTAVIALGLVTSGLMLKSAVFPLHFWLPQAHADAPAPVSALLSSLMIKASFYIALRMWLWVFPSSIQTHLAGPLLGFLGAGAIIYGSLQALHQQRLKLLIAYSTVAQLGYLFVFFALSLHPDSTVATLQAVVYFAVSHAFAKAALFMAAGVVMHVYGHDRIDELEGGAEKLPAVIFAFGVAGVSLIGLPPSGGFVGKYLLIGAAISHGQWFWALILTIGGLLTAAYLFRVLRKLLTNSPDRDQSAGAPEGHAPPPGLVWSTWATAMTALLLGLLAFHPLQVISIGAPGAGLAAPGQAIPGQVIPDQATPVPVVPVPAAPVQEDVK